MDIECGQSFVCRVNYFQIVICHTTNKTIIDVQGLFHFFLFTTSLFIVVHMYVNNPGEIAITITKAQTVQYKIAFLSRCVGTGN